MILQIVRVLSRLREFPSVFESFYLDYVVWNMFDLPSSNEAKSVNHALVKRGSELIRVGTSCPQPSSSG